MLNRALHVQKIQQITILKNQFCDTSFEKGFKKYNKLQSLRTQLEFMQ